MKFLKWFCVVVIIAFATQTLFSVAGYYIPIAVGIVFGVFFILLDSGLKKLHYKYLDSKS